MNRHADGSACAGYLTRLPALLILVASLGLTACSSGGGDGGSGVTVSGRITFERVPFLPYPQEGLNYPGTFEAPAREIEVELLQASNNAVLATATTDTSGNYALTAPPTTDVVLRAKALSRVTATSARPAAWDLRVLNNTNGNALYVLDSSVFNTGAADVTRNLRATTGWVGGFAGTYTGVRAAAPFAVLDTLYSATQFVITQGDNALQLPPLKAFWSVNNRPSAGDPADGNIETTLYGTAGSIGSEVGIYVLGEALDRSSDDTDEFDQHVLAHEFQHFLEDAISRTDTVGGPHALGEKLDMRVAFSEGFANAFSGMVLSDPVYRDSAGRAQSIDQIRFNMESDDFLNPGWFSEASVHLIIWDFFDSLNEDKDSVSFGYRPMFDVFRADLRSGAPLTSLFSFVTPLKQLVGDAASQVNDRVALEEIEAESMDAYATTEGNAGVDSADAVIVLPIYTEISLGASEAVCTDTIVGTINKIGNRRFLRFNVPTERSIKILVQSGDSDPTRDPDLVIFKNGFFDFSDCEGIPTPGCTEPKNVERYEGVVPAGDYVLEVYEYSHVDTERAPASDRTCMTVTITG